MSKTIFRELLDKEASPALGCTEPMMFALGGAITRKHAPGKVLRVDMVGCGLMVTGVQAVGIPKTGGKTGAFLAAAVGIINGDADACKEGTAQHHPRGRKGCGGIGEECGVYP